MTDEEYENQALTKKQLLELLADMPDDARVWLPGECGDDPCTGALYVTSKNTIYLHFV